MASGGAPSGLRQRQVVPELPAGASPLLAAQPFAVYQAGAGEMDGDAAAPEAVDRLPVQRVSAVGPSLSGAGDRAWMPSIHSAGV